MAKKNQKDSILEQIVAESRQMGTDATGRVATIGELCIKFGDGNKPDAEQRKTITERLKSEGLDSNVSRAIGVHALVTLCPNAVKLPVSVAARIITLVDWRLGAAKYRDGHDADVQAIVAQAVHDKWTAPQTAEEVHKVKPKKPREHKATGTALDKALVTISKATIDTIAKALLSKPELWIKLDKALTASEQLRKEAS